MRYRMLPLFLLAIVINTLCSCSPVQVEVLSPELERAEAIMYQHPDSALRILEEMPIPDSSDRLQHATWCLLITQARYKNYLVQSDSLANIAHEYFNKKSDPHKKALSLYIVGALNRDAKNIEESLAYYLEATKEIIKTEDYQLGHLIYTEIGEIYVFRRLYDYALESFQTAYNYAALANSDFYLINSLWSLGRSYSSFENWDKAIELYSKAIEQSEKLKDHRSLCNILTELSGTYLKTKEYNSALHYGHKALELQKKYRLDESISSVSLGIAYYFTGKIDSAYYYLNKATSSCSIYTRRNAYQFLYNISKERKDYVSALEYSEKRLTAVDSIRNLDRIAALTEMQEKYNQEKIINERNQLKIEKDKAVRNGLTILLMLLCAGGVMIFFYQRKILLRERTIQKKEDQIRQHLLKIHENEELIIHNSNRIQGLKMGIEEQEGVQKKLEERENAIKKILALNEELLQENTQFSENINKYTSSLQEQSKELDVLNNLSEENIRLRDREKFLCNELVKKVTVLNELKKVPKYLDVIKWAEVTEAMDWLYYNFTGRLKQDFPSLTESDLQICCLIKLHLAIPEIAVMLGISSTSVSKRKLRLKERIINDIKKPFQENQSVDIWLWDY